MRHALPVILALKIKHDWLLCDGDYAEPLTCLKSAGGSPSDLRGSL
jgi:hypothetical protein